MIKRLPAMHVVPEQRQPGVAASSQHALIQDALDEVVLRSLAPATAGLSLLYALVCIGHLALLPLAIAIPLGVVAGASTLLHVTLALLLRMQRFTAAHSHQISAIICGVALLNSALQMLLAHDQLQSTTIALLLIGVGSLVLSTPWFLGIAAVVLAVWAIVSALVGPAPQQGHLQIMMTGAAALSALIYATRLRAARRQELVSLLSTQRQQELEASLHDLRLSQAMLEQTTEQAVSASRAKSLFLSSVTHELRTPLTAIIGFSDLLLSAGDGRTQEQARSDLTQIQEAATHLQSLVDELLDLTRIEAGRMALNPSSFALHEVVSQVVETVRPLAIKSETQLSLECPAEIGRMVADVTRVRQILFNLVGNACKFTRRGIVTLRVRTEPAGDGMGAPHPVVVFTIKDTGIGMTAEQVARLFHEYAQADRTIAQRYGGTGLGLVLSKRLCDLMQGSIQVESTYGSGTTFTVMLPLVQAEERARG